MAALHPDWLALKPGAGNAPTGPRPWRSTFEAVAIWSVIWAMPMLLVAMTLGRDHVLWDIGAFFSQLAVVTFGGAYAVLAYMAQEAVQGFGWLQPGEMADGLGLAETTPGPLILVTQFVGMIAGLSEGGVILALIAGALTLWVTFVPCFIWIFAGAPYIEWISAQPKLRGALQAISGAVVGVILNLSVWFAFHVMFSTVNARQYGIVTLWQPELSSIEWRVVLLTALCAILSFKLKWSIVKVLAVSSMAGLVLTAL